MLWMTLENFMTGMADISVQAAVIFCVLLLARTVFSFCRVPKKYACFLWMILFLRLLMPVQPESPAGLWIKDSKLPFLVENEKEDYHGASIGGKAESIPVLVESYRTGAVDTLQEPYRAQGNDQIRPVLCAVWGTGCLGFLLYGGISFLRFRKKLKCSIKRDENCYLVDGIPTAFVMGFFSPRIYLPSELGGEDLDHVILHEGIHIRRKDHLIKMAAYLITCFYWFHPLVWAALIFLSRDIELSCDEAVLGQLGEGSRQKYADTLLRLSAGRHYLAGAPLAFGEGDTESRIRHILRYRKPAAAAGVVAIILIIVLAGGLLTGRSAAKEDGRIMTDQTPDLADDPSLTYYTVELPSGHIVAVSSKTTVVIDGEVYDMADLCTSVNGVMPEVREFDKYIVIQGHISPDNSYYGLFNTEKKQWEWEYIGAHLTWDENWETLENPVESVIYAESWDDQGNIRNWETNRIAVFDLDHEYVYDLKRAGDEITITILNFEEVKTRELSFDFKDSFHTLFHW